MMDSGWILKETAFAADRLHHRETVFTIGNGYLSTRGSFEEGYPAAWPATLVHGVYDDAPIVHTELANCFDWLPLMIQIDGELLRLDRGELLAFERELDLRRGTLARQVEWRSRQGYTISVRFERFASLDDPHVLALRCQLHPLDFSGEVKILAGLNGYADNQGLLHWEWLGQSFEVPGPHYTATDAMSDGPGMGQIWLHGRTRHSKIELAMAARLSVGGIDDALLRIGESPGYPQLVTSLWIDQGQELTVEKTVTVFTSRDEEEPLLAALRTLAAAAPYESLLQAHERAWSRTWDSSDVIIDGDPVAQLAVRYNLFQILIAAPRCDDRVSIPAKTLSGFGYRGHVFWDTELFVLPFLAWTQPGLARNLLSYRYHTLDGARCKAREAGYKGAMFAWESADSGDEVTPRWVPGPDGQELVRIWCGDIELHISADVAFAVWQYWRITGDDEWMQRYGAEIFLETALFWGSRAEWDGGTGAYVLRDVIGPDEYHEHVDNNFFTNRMVQWHLSRVPELLAWLEQRDAGHTRALAERLDLSSADLRRFSDIVEQIHLPQETTSGLFEQFDGFFGLQDLDLGDYEPRTKSMQALLGIQGANESQVLKQPDVLMLLFLLGEHYDQATLRTHWEYYVPRTDHTYGSSLGPAVHAILACKLGLPHVAYEHFQKAMLVDLEDLRGNTADGIHAAAAGGVWQAVVLGFGGLVLTQGEPVARACLPSGWERLRFKIQHRGRSHIFDLKRSSTLDEAPDIRAVIFDLDGVLTDTSEYHYRGWKRLAEELGIPFDRQTNEALRGLSRRDSLNVILGGRPFSDDEIQGLLARKNCYYQDSIERLTSVNLLPGVTDLLGELRTAGLKLAIASASKNARTVVERLAIADQVDLIADGYSVERPKPAPDLFLHAASGLGLPPEQCLVVEDAAAGIEAAHAAGMWSLGLGPAERVGGAHVVLPDLAAVSWGSILTALRCAEATGIQVRRV